MDIVPLDRIEGSTSADMGWDEIEDEGPLAIFDQSEYWRDRHGISHRLDGMSLEYLLNLLSFLEVQAPRLWMFHHADAAEGGSGSSIPCDEGPAWMRSTPLYLCAAVEADRRIGRDR
jgi:hypothetical protein